MTAPVRPQEDRPLSDMELAATLQSVALAIRIVGLDNLDKVTIGPRPASPADGGDDG